MTLSEDAGDELTQSVVTEVGREGVFEERGRLRKQEKE
jgi:hypothetical protein